MPEYLTTDQFQSFLKAVDTALAARPVAESAPAVPAAPQPTQRPLHELSPEEWRATADAHWAVAAPRPTRRSTPTLRGLLGDRAPE